MVADNGMLRSGAAIKIKPNKKIRGMKVNITKHRHQRVCRDCKKYKIKHIYSVCYDNNIEHWLCHTDTERSCFENNVENNHEDF